jgi:FtsH-binding integral membrane protein
MERPNAYGNYTDSRTSQIVSAYMSKVYLWMTVGVLLTGMIAMGVAGNQELLMTVLTNKILFYGIIIAQFGLVIFLSAGINKLNALMATGMFLLYAALNGVTLSVIFVAYTQESIQGAFYTSAFSFAGLSIFGYVTKKDLGPVGNFCTMGLFGLVGFSLISLFFPTLMGGVAGQVYGLVGILVFAGLTAYDTQKIKNMAPVYGNSEAMSKGAILGALKLYLDFINLFIFILRMSGKRK